MSTPNPNCRGSTGSPITTPDLPAFVAVQMRTSFAIARSLGLPSVVEEWESRATTIIARMLSLLWREDRWKPYTPRAPELQSPDQCHCLLSCCVLLASDYLPQRVA